MRHATVFAITLLLTSTAAAGDVESLLKDLMPDDAEARTAAAKELSQEKELPEDALLPVVGYIRAWLDANGDEPKSEPAPKIDGPVDHVPLVGDETSLVRVKAAPREFIGKQITITCTAEVSDYFNYGYSNASTTHFSLRCQPVDASGQFKGDDCQVYADRKVSAALVDAVSAFQEKTSKPMICRIRATLDPKRLRGDGDLGSLWSLMELLNWQFLNSDKKTWSDWQPKAPAKRQDHIKELLARLPEAAAPAMAEYCLRDTSDPVSLAVYSRLLRMPKTVRKSAADHVRKLGYKSNDKAFKRKAPAFAKSLESGKPLQ
jgi:hypothetical protein